MASVGNCLQTPHHVPGVDLSQLGASTTPDGSPTNTQNASFPCQTSVPLAWQRKQGPSDIQPFTSDSVICLKKDSYNLRQANTAQAEQLSGLRQANASQAEQIANLRIQNAVLGNDLKHAVQDKENVVSTMGIVIQSITRGTSVASAPQATFSVESSPHSESHEAKILAQNEEIGRYRRLERKLRARIAELERDDELRENARRLERHSEVRGRAREQTVDPGAMDRKQKFSEVRANQTGVDAQELDHALRIAHSHVPPSTPRQGSTNAKRVLDATVSGGMRFWAVDQDANLTPDRPNSPFVKPAYNPVSDVGMSSLEDVLAQNDGFPAAISSLPSPAKVAKSSLFDVDRTIDEQIAETAKANAKFLNMPKPGVLKVGFSSEGAVRGADFSNVKPYEPLAPLQLRTDWQRPPPLGARTTGPREYRREVELPGYLKEEGFDRNGGLWENFDDKNSAVLNHMRSAGHGVGQVDLFKYGVQYVPAETDSNYFRTVHISNLPLGTAVREVLARVRGGDVYNACVLNMGKITPDSVQARVVFKDEATAMAYVAYAEKSPIRFGAEDGKNGKVAEVTLVETPTYPIPFRAAKFLSQHTRCIAVRDIPRSFSLSTLQHNLACGNRWRAEGLIEMFIDEQDVLHLQFSSISMAGGARAFLKTSSYYRRLRCEWETDPCSGDLEELADGMKPSPPTYPANWNTTPPLEDSNGDDDDRPEGRKPFAALANQKIEIPVFGGEKLHLRSWADEVNGDLSDAEPSPESSTILSKDSDSTSSDLVESSNLDANSPVVAADITDVLEPRYTSSPTIVASGSSVVGTQDASLMAASVPEPDSPIPDGKLPAGLAGSRYAPSPRTFTEPTVPRDRFNLQPLALTKKLPRSAPRVKLSALIDSPPGSPTSASQLPSVVHHTDPADDFPPAIQNDAAAAAAAAAAKDKNATMLTPLLSQCLGDASTRKKRTYSATEEGVEEPVSHVSDPSTLPVTEDQAAEFVTVSNPDEISLDDTEDEHEKEGGGEAQG